MKTPDQLFNSDFFRTVSQQPQNVFVQQQRRKRGRTPGVVTQERQNYLDKIPGRIPLPAGFDESGVGNCGVVALAIACGVAYQTMWSHFAAKQKKPSAWKGSTYHSTYSPTLEKFGVTYKHTSYEKPTSLFSRRSGSNMSVADFALRAKANTTYLVRVRGHVLILRNQFYFDQRGGFPLGGARGAGQKVLDVWEIIDRKPIEDVAEQLRNKRKGL